MTKVTVYVDNDVWSRFRAGVFQKHGSLKVLSKQVEESLKSSIDEEVLSYLTNLQASVSPKTRTLTAQRGPPAQVQIRRMRRKRIESLS